MVLDKKEVKRTIRIIDLLIESEIGDYGRLIKMEDMLRKNGELGIEDKNYFSEKLKRYKQLEKNKEEHTPEQENQSPKRQSDNVKWIVLAAVICSVIAVFGIMGIRDYYDQMITAQKIEHYNQFMTKANSLEALYIDNVRRCQDAHPTALPPNVHDFDVCTRNLVGNYKSDFTSLVKNYGYEDNLSRLYDLWVPQLQLQIDLTRINIEFGDEPSYISKAFDPAEYWKERYFAINVGNRP